MKNVTSNEIEIVEPFVTLTLFSQKAIFTIFIALWLIDNTQEIQQESLAWWKRYYKSKKEKGIKKKTIEKREQNLYLILPKSKKNRRVVFFELFPAGLCASRYLVVIATALLIGWLADWLLIGWKR